MSTWWGKRKSKDVNAKVNKGSFFDAIHRRFKFGSTGKKKGNDGSVGDTIIKENVVTASLSVSQSLPVSRCQSFAKQPQAQPLPLPGLHHASVRDSATDTSNLELNGCSKSTSCTRHSRDGDHCNRPRAPHDWGGLATASVSSNSSMDTDDQPDSRLLSPQASDYESGNVSAIHSPSSKRHKDQTPAVTQRILKDQWKSVKPPNNNHITLSSNKRRPLGAQMAKLKIPPRAGFISAPGSLISSPLHSPVGVCGHDQGTGPRFCTGQACLSTSLVETGHCSTPSSGPNSGRNSVGVDTSIFWPQSRCSSECSPVPSPRMNSPGSRIQSAVVTPLHSRSGGLATEISLDKTGNGRQQSHRLPCPPMTLSTSCPISTSDSSTLSPTLLRNPARTGSSTSPVSPWKKGRLLGSGTFGHVYLGFNRANGEMCAMKEVTLYLDDAKSMERVQQLAQEITLLSRIRHPNIVRYFGSETVDDKLYIYLEYVSGGSIHKILQEYGKLGESAIRSYTKQILSGLAYLHARNTVHRDIKGANILVDPTGRVKLADFGMAKHITGQSSPLSFKGSPHWMAPEVIKNSNGCNLAVDIWSLGCTVIEMATTKPPWSQYEGVAALFKIGTSKELPAVPGHLSEEGKDFVRQCLQRNPLERPTALQLLQHPFVRNASPSGRSLPRSERLEVLHTDVADYMDNRRPEVFSPKDSRAEVTLQLSKGFSIGPGSRGVYSPKHVSCPVSPIGSPLLRPKSSQSAYRRRYPSSVSSPDTFSAVAFPLRHLEHSKASHSCDCLVDGRPQKRLHARGNLRSSKPMAETLSGIPEISQVNGKIVSTQTKGVGSRFASPVRDERKLYHEHLTSHLPQHLLVNHLKLKSSLHSSILRHTNKT